ncbi:hypothetical protein BDQ17DRAFT_1428017 [Cyathus striatus]|nr:hypothetical protein BDQ17DRAFT_1428017 [Cyathus striatus]
MSGNRSVFNTNALHAESHSHFAGDIKGIWYYIFQMQIDLNFIVECKKVALSTLILNPIYQVMSVPSYPGQKRVACGIDDCTHEAADLGNMIRHKERKHGIIPAKRAKRRANTRAQWNNNPEAEFVPWPPTNDQGKSLSLPVEAAPELKLTSDFMSFGLDTPETAEELNASPFDSVDSNSQYYSRAYQYAVASFEVQLRAALLFDNPTIATTAALDDIQPQQSSEAESSASFLEWDNLINYEATGDDLGADITWRHIFTPVDFSGNC